MDDADIVAAIAADELGGLTAALMRYAAPLYESCYAMAPEAAADVVRDTFIVAWCRLYGLRDPDKLETWLQAVAANECFRRTLASPSPSAYPGDDAPSDAGAEPVLPPELPGQVLSVCADNTPAARAQRTSITHRAGPFGPDGFPKAGARPGTGWRIPRLAAVIAGAAVLMATATAIAMIGPTGSARHIQASGARPGNQSAAASPSGADLPTTPAQPIPSSASATPPRRPRPAAAAKHVGVAEASPPVIPMARVMPKSPAPPRVAQGFLAVDQAQLTIVSAGGRAATRTFVLTAENGPVDGFTITVLPGLPGSLTVSPSSGSLAAGDSVTVTVTAATTVPFVTALALNPGGDIVAVVVKVNPGGGQGNGNGNG